MKRLLLLLILFGIVSGKNLFASNVIPADNTYIQYFGRWDFSNPKAPTHSWPGVYIYVEFEGTSIGIKTDDNFSYYNVIIDDTVTSVFHGDKAGVNSYILKEGLPDGHHKLLFTLRNELSWTKFAFNGFILDDGKNLLPPPPKPERKIEFVGNSYTCAAGNLWTGQNPAPSDSDYTDIYQGFASIVGRHYDAQYNISAHSGYGMVQDYQGNTSGNLPDIFNRTLVYTSSPTWNFSDWVPNVIVICLGLNDYSGWNGYSQSISDENSALFRQKYHDFISTLIDVYPGVKILCVAANGIGWIKDNVSQVVTEENAKGNENVYYTFFPYYDGGYVNQGHPNVDTHKKIADVIITAINQMDPWTPYNSKTAPAFVSLPKPNTLVTTVDYNLTVKTNKYSTVRYSTQDKPYDQMENTFAVTGQRDHSTIIHVKQNQSYKFYLRAADIYGNQMDTSAVVQFWVDTTKNIFSWNQPGYDISAWGKSSAPFGNDGASTNITNINSVQTSYFKTTLPITSVFQIIKMILSAKGHDGLTAYINGKEAIRMNMDSGKDINYDTYASAAGSFGSSIDIAAVAKPLLRIGSNDLAVEVHSSNSGSGISFDMQLADAVGKLYLSFGSQWYYYDSGNTPSDQITDKITGVENLNSSLPLNTELFQNYPNPFNPTTVISFELNKKSLVQLKVYNILGELVSTLENGELNAGNYKYLFDGGRLASGVYFYQLKADGSLKVFKMILMK